MHYIGLENVNVDVLDLSFLGYIYKNEYQMALKCDDGSRFAPNNETIIISKDFL